MARPRSDIAPRILRAARARFRRQGVDGTSLREIARDAATSIGMIHYHFRTKDDLFLAVVEEVYAGILLDLTAAVDVPGPARDRIGALYRRVGSLKPEELEVLQLIVREALGSPHRLGRLLQRFMVGHIPLVLRAIEDGQREGVIDPTLPAPLVLMCAFALGGPPQVIRRALGDGMPLPVPGGAELSRVLERVLFEGVGPRR